MSGFGPDAAIIWLADRLGWIAQERTGLSLPALLYVILRIDQGAWFVAFAIYTLTGNPISGFIYGLYGGWRIYKDRNRTAQLSKDKSEDWTEKLFQRYARAAHSSQVRFLWSRNVSLVVCAALALGAIAIGSLIGGWDSLLLTAMFIVSRFIRLYGECVMPYPPAKPLNVSRPAVRKQPAAGSATPETSN